MLELWRGEALQRGRRGTAAALIGTPPVPQSVILEPEGQQPQNIIQSPFPHCLPFKSLGSLWWELAGRAEPCSEIFRIVIIVKMTWNLQHHHCQDDPESPGSSLPRWVGGISSRALKPGWRVEHRDEMKCNLSRCHSTHHNTTFNTKQYNIQHNTTTNNTSTRQLGHSDIDSRKSRFFTLSSVYFVNETNGNTWAVSLF